MTEEFPEVFPVTGASVFLPEIQSILGRISQVRSDLGDSRGAQSIDDGNRMCAVIVGAEDVEPGLAMRLQKPLVGRNRRAPEAVAIDAYAVDQDRGVLVERIPAPGEPPRPVLHDQDLV